MFTKKINQISDSLHGSIQISELEKTIISTQVFNRLHHVLQNSTAYLTFPTNKTSRFAHSIGVMHLGGEMFRYAVTNGENIAIENLLRVIETFLNTLSDNNEDFRREVGISFNSMTEYKRMFTDLKRREFDDSFYKANSPFLISQEQLYSYIVVYQSLRLSALLHDLGHPPFSHITEDALDSIYASIQSKIDRGDRLNGRETDYYNTIKEYKISGDKLHEKLSKHLVTHVFSSTLNAIENKEKIIFYLHVKFVTLAILNDFSEDFKEIHRVVDGVIDCDRLDYVSRDPLASGFNDGQIEYGRIIKTMKLAQNGASFKFCFSSSVMNTIEDFLNRRWRMYKHVILHHRVVKTDLLLNQTIRSLAEEYLLEKEPKEVEEDYDFTIPNDISGLWKTVGKSFNLTHIDYINHFIQWDDSWLLSCLRREYFKRKHNQINDATTIQLEELLSNKKHYFSLYKRYDGLLPLDLALLEHFDEGCLVGVQEKQNAKALVQIISYYKTEYRNEIEQGRSWASRVPMHGLFIIAITELFSNLGKDHEILSMLNNVANAVKAEYNIVDIIVKKTKLSTGLSNEAIIYDEHGIKSIQDNSRIEVDLKSNKGVFPPYFIYMYTAGRSLSKDELREVKEKIGKGLAEEINKFFNELGGDLNVQKI
ncbi:MULTISPECIES: hypothetical protein [Paenibacillus]|nr:hypothetical protein [Paenibacillus odorifer]